MNETKQRISKLLKIAAENEDLSKGFYADLVYTPVDEHYIENLLRERAKKRRQQKRSRRRKKKE